MVSGNLSGINLSTTGSLLSAGVLVLIYELVGIFLPLCCCTGRGGKAQRKGASRHAYFFKFFYFFTVAKSLLCPVTEPGTGTEVSLCCCSATKHESEEKKNKCMSGLRSGLGSALVWVFRQSTF